MPRYVVSCLVQNGPLTLARVAGLCVHRRYAVEAVITTPTSSPGVSLITLVVESSELRMANVIKQLDKLIDVLYVNVLPPDPPACELLLQRISSALSDLASCHPAASGMARYLRPERGLFR
jgi:acetolactate synthase I/III small subunit